MKDDLEAAESPIMRDELIHPVRFRTRRRLGWLALVLVLALFAGLFYLWRDSRSERRLGPELRVVRPAQQALSQSLSVRARIEAGEQQDVLSAGVPVTHVYVEESQQVRRGDLLLRYDLSGLEKAYEEARQLRLDSEAQLAAMQAEQSRLGSLSALGDLDGLSGLSGLDGLDGLGELGTLDGVDFAALSGANMSELDRLNESLSRLQGTLAGFTALGSSMSGFQLPDVSGLESLAELEGLLNTLQQLQSGMSSFGDGAALQGIGELSQHLEGLLFTFQATLTQLEDFVAGLRQSYDETLGAYEERREEWEARARELEEQLQALLAQLPSELPSLPSELPSLPSELPSLPSVTWPLPSLSEDSAPSPGDAETEEPGTEPEPELTTPSSASTSAADTTAAAETTAADTTAGGAAMFSGLGEGLGNSAALQEAQLAEYLKQLESQLVQANSLLGGSRLSEEQALKLLEETPQEVRADFDGIVSGINVAVGDEVAAGRLLLTVYAQDSIQARFDANRSDLARIAVGQAVSYRYGELRFTGEITRITRVSAQVGQTASSLLQSSGVEATVPVSMSIEGVPEAREALVIGFDIDASILLSARDDVLAIPLDAVLYRDEEPWVWVVNAEERLEARPVRLGLVADFAAEILDGLTTRDRVILHPSAALKAGDPVRALEAPGD
ncbi:MAG: HlyD family efflux transporter periplasmic adaptor subunit [Bacillota bacterium]|nr:HlyD family efflux transporter periplasmic adaptor subunit [Bacillota bacterium]